jgi:hypothetical protein
MPKEYRQRGEEIVEAETVVKKLKTIINIVDNK